MCIRDSTYSNRYWLLPRAKWAVVGFWAIGVAILMDIAATEQLLAAGNTYYASQVAAGGNTTNGVDRTGRQMALLGATGMMVIGMLAFMSYTAMPPRTGIVKNSVLSSDAANTYNGVRRTSISHNAETRIGHNFV